MKLFLFLAVSALFTACAPQDNSSTTDPEQTSSDTPRTVSDPAPNSRTFPKPVKGLENSGLAINTDEEETEAPGTEPPAQTAEQPTGPQKLTSIKKPIPSPASPAVDPSEEEITSMEEPLPEDPIDDLDLISKIEERYSDYVGLREVWAEHSLRIEKVMDQATNPVFLKPFLIAQNEIEQVPVTKAQIEEMKEKLSDEGIFTHPEDRVKAQYIQEDLNHSVNTLEASVGVSLAYTEQAETDPDIMYAEAPKEDESTETVAAASTASPETIPSGEPENKTDVLVAVPVANTTPGTTTLTAVASDGDSVTGGPQEEEDTASSTNTPQSPSVVTSSTGSIAAPEEKIPSAEPVSPTASPPEADALIEIATVETTPSIETSSTDQEDLIAVEAVETPAVTTGSGTTPSDENPEAVAVESSTTAPEAVSTEESPSEPWWNWDRIVENTSNVWNSFVDSITPGFLSNPAEYVLRPTQLSVEPRASLIDKSLDEPTANEEDPNDAGREQAYLLIDQLLQNVSQLVQAHDIKNLEDLKSYTEEIPTNPEERTADQTDMLSMADQAFQNMANSPQPMSTADFVEFSGYTSEHLSQEEITGIIGVLFDFIIESEEQEIQRELG